MALKKGIPQALMAEITEDEVRNVAGLANIKIPENEIKEMAKTLSNVLDHIAQLQKLDTRNVMPTSHAIESKNVFREDEVKAIFEKGGKLLDNAPARDQNYFSVPRVIE